VHRRPDIEAHLRIWVAGIVASTDGPAGLRPDNVAMRQTVLIVDDNTAFRASARALLEADGYVVIGDAADGAGAVIQAERLRPDIVLLDIQLPDEDGFSVADRLAAGSDPPVVVLVSGRPVETYAARLATTTALGFLAKDELVDGGLAALIG
jgi:DNA-binding NarL/FixJ family response regulator